MNTLPQPLVSLITINYNGKDVTAELLKSLRKVSYPNIEIIVVDNASSENPDELKEKYPEITLIKSPQNLGFAGGNNIGIKAAKGEFIMLINNDTEPDSHFIEPIISAFQNDNKLGCISSKLVFFNRDETIQYAGHQGLNWLTGRGFSRGFGERDSGQYNDQIPIQLAHGAAMTLRRAMIEEIGMMYEKYFLYYEEVDYSTRILNSGWRINYVGNSKVYHKESMSVGKASPLKVYYLTRNRLMYIRRNLTGIRFLLALFFYLFISFPKGLIVQLKSGKTHVKAYLKALVWHLKPRNIHNQTTL